MSKLVKSKIDEANEAYRKSGVLHRMSVKELIKAGQALRAIREEVGHGNFLPLFERGDFLFKYGTANKLMAIAENPLLLRHVKKLPASPKTLAVLAKLSEQRFEDAVETKLIHREMTLKDAEQLTSKAKSKRLVDEDAEDADVIEPEPKKPVRKVGPSRGPTTQQPLVTQLRALKKDPTKITEEVIELLREIIDWYQEQAGGDD